MNTAEEKVNLKKTPSARVLVTGTETSLEAVLTEAGCEVSVAQNGAEGLQKLFTQPYDLAVTTSELSPMGGALFLEEAAKIWPWIGTLLLTDSEENVRTAPLTIILNKHCDSDELVKTALRAVALVHRRMKTRKQLSSGDFRHKISAVNKLLSARLTNPKPTWSPDELVSDFETILPNMAVGIFDREAQKTGLFLSSKKRLGPSLQNRIEKVFKARFEALLQRDPPRNLPFYLSNGQTLNAEILSAGEIRIIPLVSGAIIGALLVLVTPPKQPYTEEEFSCAYHSANHLFGVLKTFQQVHAQAIRDELTGLYNRGYLESATESLWKLGDRKGFKISIIILDVDNFKETNDLYGHLTGDRLLEELARLIENLCRKSDIVARYGGDEFVLVLPNTDSEGLSVLSERILKNVATHSFCENSPPLHCTLSLGGASNSKTGEQGLGFKETLQHADQALYEAKQTGFNQYRIYSDHPPKTIDPQEGTPHKSTALSG